MKRLSLVGLLLVIALLIPSRAYADLTAFFGVNPTPVNRPVRGFAIGAGLLIVGFEFEYANTSDDEVLLAPKLQTYMFNGLVQTPVPIAGMQFYGTAGGGGYREELFDFRETYVGYNIGGGIKMVAGRTAAAAVRLSGVHAEGRVAACESAAVLRGDQPEVLTEGGGTKRKPHPGVRLHVYLSRRTLAAAYIPPTLVMFSLLTPANAPANFLNISCVSGARFCSSVIVLYNTSIGLYSVPATAGSTTTT